MGGTRDGTVEAYRLTVVQDAGRLPGHGRGAAVHDQVDAPRRLRHPRQECVPVSVVTNTTPIVAYRGAGRPEAAAAVERIIDLFADEIGMDPAEVRRRNFIAKDAFPYTTPAGLDLRHAATTSGALDLALEAAGYDDLRRRAGAPAGQRRPGASSASASPPTWRSPAAPASRSTAPVEVRPDGSAVVHTGTSPHGQGHVTAWSMLVAATRPASPWTASTSSTATPTWCPGAGARWARGRCSRAASPSTQATQTRSSSGPGELAPTCSRPAPTTSWSTRPRAGSTSPARPPVGQDVGRAGAAAAEADGGARRRDRPARPGHHVPVRRPRRRRRGRHRDRQGRACAGWSPSTTPAASSTRCSPRARSTAGSRRASPRRCSRRSATTTTATRSPSNLADYTFISAAELPSFETVHMETPTPLNPLGAKGIGESGTIGSTPGGAERGRRRPVPPRRPPHRHADHTRAGVGSDRRRRAT